MERIRVHTANGVKEESLFAINELSFLSHLMMNKDCKKRQYIDGKSRTVTYLNVPCAFDIETTNIDEARAQEIGKDRPFAFMYHWQFCIGNEVVFGRTWNEFIKLLRKLQSAMRLDEYYRIVVYCHNLSYEFQFMRRFINVISGFWKEKYKPLSVVTSYGIEFRDSLALTNMSLEKFTKQENCIYQKNDGEIYDYNKIRTPETPLTEYERSYCYCDVRGLSEAIGKLMQQDDLAHIPLTSTGYVRRDARNAMRKNKRNRAAFTQCKLDLDLYNLCHDAFRGGDTHANAAWVNQVLESVTSYDIQSSYPTSMMCDLFPVTPWEKIAVSTFEEYDFEREGYAVLFRVRLMNVRYIGTCGNPYISFSKCINIIHKGKIIDNGRVMYAQGVELALTDIDWKIIQNEYIFDEVYYSDIYVSRYGYLPQEYKEIIMQYYKGKTELKGVDAYNYMKSKNKLNSLYGMMVTNILQLTTEYKDNEYVEEKTLTPDEEKARNEELLNKYYKSRNNFLSYQWGIWVTAHARYRLRRAMWAVGKDMVYCDTDSIKFVGDHNDVFEKLNIEAIQNAKDHNAYAIDKNGKTQYMGIWDYEGVYKRFKTLGAKKYCIEKEGEVLTTIAGVSKNKGREYFTKVGIENFKVGAKIMDAGHLVAYYNDDNIHDIEINDCKIKTASNIALLEGGYEVGMTNEYKELIKILLDNGEIIY